MSNLREVPGLRTQGPRHILSTYRTFVRSLGRLGRPLALLDGDSSVKCLWKGEVCEIFLEEMNTVWLMDVEIDARRKSVLGWWEC